MTKRSRSIPRGCQSIIDWLQVEDRISTPEQQLRQAVVNARAEWQAFVEHEQKRRMFAASKKHASRNKTRPQ